MRKATVNSGHLLDVPDSRATQSKRVSTGHRLAETLFVFVWRNLSPCEALLEP